MLRLTPSKPGELRFTYSDTGSGLFPNRAMLCQMGYTHSPESHNATPGNRQDLHPTLGLDKWRALALALDTDGPACYDGIRQSLQATSPTQTPGAFA